MTMAEQLPSDQHAAGSFIAQASQGSRASVNVYTVPPLPKDFNRHRLLAKVHAFWITGVLEHSLYGADLIKLGLQEQSINPCEDVDHPISSLPCGMHITQIYDQVEGELLILGAPGSGKTTLLLQLARDLITRAKQDENHPMPVVFNLSSWAIKRQPLTEWLVEELNSKYQVPQKLGQQWIAEDKILLLLDGLDEVINEYHAACVAAINTYRQEHGLISMVVCCRNPDSDTQRPSTHPLLSSAIVVQPLTAEQIDDYLASGGEKLSVIRELLQNDPGLQEMAATPLMLSVLMQAYAGRQPNDLLVASTPQIRRQQVFVTYVEQMLHHRGDKNQYTPQQVKHWLAWLAQQMKRHNQTEFYLERMQPDEIPSVRKWYVPSYNTLVRVGIGSVFGLIAGLIFCLDTVLRPRSLPLLIATHQFAFGLVFGLISGLLYGLVSRVEPNIKPAEAIVWSWENIWQCLRKSETLMVLLLGVFGALLGRLDQKGLFGSHKLLEVLLGGLLFGLLGNLLLSLLSELHSELVRNAPKKPALATLKQQSWHSIYNRMLVGLIFGLVAGLIFGFLLGLLAGMQGGLQTGLLAGLISGIFIEILSGLFFAVKSEGEIELKPVQGFAWLLGSTCLRLGKSKELILVLAFGLIFGLFNLMVNNNVNDPKQMLFWGLIYGLVCGLMLKLFCELASGLSSKMVEEQTFVRPNQGIRRSAHNSVIVGLIFGLLIMFVVGPLQALTLRPNSPSDIILITLSYGLLSVPLIGLPNGGVACIQHGILRLFLQRVGSIPRHYTRFLDYAAELLLLQKVGGGYIFIHRLLMEHFATQDAISTSMRSTPKYLAVVGKKEQEDLEEQEADGLHIATQRKGAQSSTLRLQSLLPTQTLKQSSTRRVGLIVTLIILLIAVGATGVILRPKWFPGQPTHMGTTQPAAIQATSVGQVTFTSSGQLDPVNSRGLNDIVTVSLHKLSTPAPGKSYFAWLLPDQSHQEAIQPLLLGKLAITRAGAQFTYVHPDHSNLLASYSGFQVTEQQSDQVPSMPSLDPKTWHYIGSIPNIPTPGEQYSLLDHIRHLIAKDPTLQKNGLAGGLASWLRRNTEKIQEWSIAARDSWAEQQTDLIHRHIIRVLDYLDGVAYVATSGDLPPDSSPQVDSQAGRIGLLLEVSPTQTLPPYLTHIQLHLRGLIDAPGHTQEQRQLAIKIDATLNKIKSQMQKIHQDAVILVKMDDKQLQSQEALTRLNDMVTNATNAYVGQFDPASSGNINGVVWIYNELQGLAIIPVTLHKG
jgi:hypothetical protein